TLGENPEYNTPELTDWVYDAFKQSIELEIEWSNYVLQNVDGIDLVEMEGYIKYRGNKMLRMMALNELYPEHVDNPMKWISAYVDNFDGTKTYFFEQKSRQYTKTSELNCFDDLQNEFENGNPAVNNLQDFLYIIPLIKTFQNV